jgi:hypothetical protein
MKRPSLEALASAVAPVSAAQLTPVAGNMVPVAPRFVRADRPHVSLYLDKRVQKVIKEIALTYDRKPHDLYIDAVNLLLRSYGKPTVAEIAPMEASAT